MSNFPKNRLYQYFINEHQMHLSDKQLKEIQLAAFSSIDDAFDIDITDEEFINDLDTLLRKRRYLKEASRTRAYGSGSISHFYDVKYNFLQLYEKFILKYKPSQEWIDNFYPHKIK